MLKVKHFFDKKTFTLSYIVYDESSLDGVVIDPVWNFDQASGTLLTESITELNQYLNDHKINLHYILETHVHADHVSGSQLIKKTFPKSKILIGEHICKVQKTFKEVFNLPDSFKTDGSQFDGLLKDGSIVKAGSFEFKVLNTPGHTPACISYLFKGMVFTGDALFMPDSGTGRCDFPSGSAHDLYNSITQKIYTLPEETMMYTGHDYQPNNRELKFSATIKEQKENNIQLKAHTTEEEFIEFRTKRDAGLSAPQLLLPSLQINIRGGRLPEQESNNVSYLKIPLKTS